MLALALSAKGVPMLLAVFLSFAHDGRTAQEITDDFFQWLPALFSIPQKHTVTRAVGVKVRLCCAVLCCAVLCCAVRPFPLSSAPLFHLN